jgi:hypothetical protein
MVIFFHFDDENHIFYAELIGSRKGNFTPLTLEEYNRQLEEADQRIETGHFVSQEDLEKEMKTW